jgi:hypothetical protein
MCVLAAASSFQAEAWLNAMELVYGVGGCHMDAGVSFSSASENATSFLQVRIGRDRDATAVIQRSRLSDR